MGGFGGKIVTAGTYTGNYGAIKILESSVITAVGNIENLTNRSFVAGEAILGEFTSVIVTSGTVLLCNSK